MLQATVSGSFHRHMQAIVNAVDELNLRQVRVLSPADPRVVDYTGEFLFVASDRVRSIRMVQDRHLQAIRASNFLWLVAPDGYVGQSASLELGFAYAHDVPIFSLSEPSDLTLRQYVRKVSSLDGALAMMQGDAGESPTDGELFWINPHATIEAAQQKLEEINRILKRKPDAVRAREAEEIYRLRKSITNAIALAPHPTSK
jgi:hypothetical protein